MTQTNDPTRRPEPRPDLRYVPAHKPELAPRPAERAPRGPDPVSLSAVGLDLLLTQVGEEAGRRMTGGADIDAAYSAAVTEVFKRLVEGRQTEAFETRLLDTLRSLSRAQGGRPVRTTRLATELGQSTWATWYYLTRLEARGLVVRPGGKKSGWVAG